MGAGCIRVAHPCDTLGSILLSNLPFVLHVLGLPLAFILSQDQTLHSILFNADFRINPSIATGFQALAPFGAYGPLPMSLSLVLINNPKPPVRTGDLKEPTRAYPLSDTHGPAINLHPFKERSQINALHEAKLNLFSKVINPC